ncbi:imelysin family protein [Pararhodobacter sp. CCB-MM2]|uniref:imelysin family protein n=1 Tax=Pararhodobacter sp. CCB-MM2 TaxID=1786003 RepID=UPI00082DF323|nr:imelysin family protein [Pararhodobacter sp. CCB-MM2]
MRHLNALALLALTASPALADVGQVLDAQVLPGTAAFAEASTALATAAAADCRPAAVTDAWNAAFDAWLAIGHLRMGPQELAALTIAFWPDGRNSGRRTLARMIEGEDAMGTDASDFAQVSAAARGLYALETMLYDPDFASYEAGSYSCTLVQVMAQDLASQAAALDLAWREDFAPALRSAGSPDNAQFLSANEAERAIFTQLHGGVEFNADQRLGQPMGTPDRPRPTRAETWRAGRSQRNIELSMAAIQAMAQSLAGHSVEAVDSAFSAAAYFGAGIEDPAFQDVEDPQARFRLESWQGRIRAAGDALIVHIGEEMGIAPGFNSLDGD